MRDKLKSERISRRGVFSLLGFAAAVSLAMPAAMLVGSDANAQTGGMERRDDRREGRQERRDDRQTDRQERRSKKKKKNAK